MFSGMRGRRVPVVLGEQDLAQLRAMKAVGEIDNVAGFVRHAVRLALLDRVEFKALLEESLERSGGPLTEAEKAWADRVLGV